MNRRNWGPESSESPEAVGGIMKIIVLSLCVVITGNCPHPTQLQPPKSPVCYWLQSIFSSSSHLLFEPHNSYRIGWVSDLSAPILLIRVLKLREPKPKAPEEVSSGSILLARSPCHTEVGSLPFPRKRVRSQQGLGWWSQCHVTMAAYHQDADRVTAQQICGRKGPS